MGSLLVSSVRAENATNWIGTHWTHVRWNGANEVLLAYDAALVPDTVAGTVLRVSPAKQSALGAVLATQPVDVRRFSTRFVFRMGEPGSGPITGGDGMVFVIKAHRDQMGGRGGAIGYFGTPRSIGVEFDSFYNPQEDDPDSQHFALRFHGEIHVATNTVSLPDDLNDGRLFYAWIDYDGAQIEIRVSRTAVRPVAASLSRAIDLPGVVGGTTAWVGFTSATATAEGNHDILSWDFRSTNAPYVGGDTNLFLPRWVAYNDHSPGTETSSRTTLFQITTNATYQSSAGFLKDGLSGTNLLAHLAITQSGVVTSTASATPRTSSRAYHTFEGMVDFNGGNSPGIELAGAAFVTYAFSGLNPAARYVFVGTGVRGDSTYTNRWTLCELNGAIGFTPDHSTGVLTSAQVPALASNAVALNTGYNSAGDVVSWRHIQPSVAGTFSMTCRQYTGTVPGGNSGGSKGYAITATRLEEEGTVETNQQPAAVVLPSEIVAKAGDYLSINPAIGGAASQRYQWSFRGTPLAAETNRTLILSNVQAWHGGEYRVFASNTWGISTAAVLVVPAAEISLLATGSIWRYLDNGTDQGSAWAAPAFNDSGWSNGPAQLGYGDGDERTLLSYGTNSNAKFVTTYFRRSFFVADPSQVLQLNGHLLRDDAAVVFLNGQEVFRDNLLTSLNQFNALAIDAIDAGYEGLFLPFTIPPSQLVPGTNVLAVEIHQAALNSTDISFDLSLDAWMAIPDLRIQPAASAGNIELRWPSDPAFVLQRASPLGNTSAWSVVPEVPVSAGGTNLLVLPVTSNSNVFFQLRK